MCSKFNFLRVRSIELNWIESLKPQNKYTDYSIYGKTPRLDVYVLCLKNGFFPDEKSLIFHNNCSNSDKSISSDFDIIHSHYPGHDRCFYLKPDQLNDKYDEIIFVIGRPRTENKINTIFNDYEHEKKVTNEICYVDCRFNTAYSRGYVKIKNIAYNCYKYKDMVLFKFVKHNNNWAIDLGHNIYNNGFQEIIIEKHTNLGNKSM